VSDDGQNQALTVKPAKPGIGSTIIRSLVAQLDGTIDVRRENGMTTEIRLAMPVRS
jgi:two-component sensor histidine kinase